MTEPQQQTLEAAAHELGARGAPPSESERLLFEAWMRGHCWKVVGEWNGKQYVHASEVSGYAYPPAMNTRQLWAAWRDARALAAAAPKHQEDADDEATRDRMADILTRTVNAIRGEPGPLRRWSWHDLPDRAAAAIASIDVMTRSARQLAAAPKWLPIETAPKDGTEFLAYRRGLVATAYRVPRDDCEMWSFGSNCASVEYLPDIKPTHWMHLPVAPSHGSVVKEADNG